MRMLNMLRAMDAFVGDQDDGGVEEVAREAPVTCPTCGAPVEDDALEAQTMPDGSLMWPQPFCRASESAARTNGPRADCVVAPISTPLRRASPAV